MNKTEQERKREQDKQAEVVPAVERPVIPDKEYDIRSYGAVGDGLTMNTDAIARAIEDCAENGGGTVTIPAGVWRTGPITLRSRIELHAAAGALVLFSTRYEDYPLIVSSYEGLPAVRCKAPLDGEGLEDVAVTGAGIFDGGGQVWRPVKKMKMTDSAWRKLIESGGVVDDNEAIWWPTEESLRGAERIAAYQAEGNYNPADYEPFRTYLRPVLLSLRRCKRVLLDGPTFQNSAGWCLHPWICEHLTVRGVTVRNPWYAQNGDGIDLDSCRNVLVEDSVFDVGDDAICLKSGKDEAGRTLAKPCEAVRIERCAVYHGHGGVVIGSEMSGGVRNVRISDCTFIGTDIGLRFKSARGRGGIVEDITAKRVRMADIAGDAVSFNFFYEGKEGSGFARDEAAEVTEGTPIFRNIHLEDILCAGARKALVVYGLPEMPLQGLTVKGMDAECEQGIDCRYSDGMRLENIRLRVRSGDPITLVLCEGAVTDARSV